MMMIIMTIVIYVHAFWGQTQGYTFYCCFLKAFWYRTALPRVYICQKTPSCIFLTGKNQTQPILTFKPKKIRHLLRCIICHSGPSLGISRYLSARALPLLAGICPTTILPFIFISLETEFWIEDINLLSFKSEWKKLLQKLLLLWTMNKQQENCCCTSKGIT